MKQLPANERSSYRIRAVMSSFQSTASCCCYRYRVNTGGHNLSICCCRKGKALTHRVWAMRATSIHKPQCSWCLWDSGQWARTDIFMAVSPQGLKPGTPSHQSVLKITAVIWNMQIKHEIRINVLYYCSSLPEIADPGFQFSCTHPEALTDIPRQAAVKWFMSI